jgi:hypothetical protein
MPCAQEAKAGVSLACARDDGDAEGALEAKPLWITFEPGRDVHLGLADHVEARRSSC